MGKNILQLEWDGETDWTAVVGERDRWRAFLNAVMNLRVT
jgi:hypothetical protein